MLVCRPRGQHKDTFSHDRPMAVRGKTRLCLDTSVRSVSVSPLQQNRLYEETPCSPYVAVLIHSSAKPRRFAYGP
jgi:hypothetical protein